LTFEPRGWNINIEGGQKRGKEEKKEKRKTKQQTRP
jgi:hypothetical protein